MEEQRKAHGKQGKIGHIKENQWKNLEGKLHQTKEHKDSSEKQTDRTQTILKLNPNPLPIYSIFRCVFFFCFKKCTFKTKRPWRFGFYPKSCSWPQTSGKTLTKLCATRRQYCMSTSSEALWFNEDIVNARPFRPVKLEIAHHLLWPHRKTMQKDAKGPSPAPRKRGPTKRLQLPPWWQCLQLLRNKPQLVGKGVRIVRCEFHGMNLNDPLAKVWF